MRYFKKLEPKNTPVLANGAHCKFTTLDNLTGYFATDNDYIAAEFTRLTAEGRYGIAEITAEEFVQDYVEPKKNGKTPRPVWREEVGAPGNSRGRPILEQIGQQRVERAVTVAAAKPNPPEDGAAGAMVADPNRPDAPPGPDLKSTVKVGKRVKKDKAEHKPI